MQNRFVVTLAAFASLAALSAPAFAQDAAAPATTGHTMEYGIDAGLDVNLGTPKTTTINIPVQAFRVGFYLDPKLSIEPMVAFSSQNQGGTDLGYQAALGVLWHFQAANAGPYVRPFAGIEGYRDPSNSNSNAILGAGIGYKHHLWSRVTGRAEVNYTHTFDSDAPSNTNNDIGLNLGLSFLTH